MFEATGVQGRYLTLPIEAYTTPRSFGASNDIFIDVATRLSAEAAREALARAGVPAAAVDLLAVVTTTGVASPSIDARLMNLIEFRPNVRRLPVVGLGCVGGASGLARCAEYLRGAPDEIALLVCVELCSLTFQTADTSSRNLVATALFGDAAAAAVIGGGASGATRPRIVESRSVFRHDSEGVLGFAIGDSGFRVVLGGDLPEVAVRGLAGEVDALLAAHGVGRADVGPWIVHPGGPKVLQAVARELGLPTEALEPSWACLRRIGNVSSASVLCILAELMEAPPPRGTWSVMIGMGPGFSVEITLLRWD